MEDSNIVKGGDIIKDGDFVSIIADLINSKIIW
jgi:hypothetical protein